MGIVGKLRGLSGGGVATGIEVPTDRAGVERDEGTKAGVVEGEVRIVRNPVTGENEVVRHEGEGAAAERTRKRKRKSPLDVDVDVDVDEGGGWGSNGETRRKKRTAAEKTWARKPLNDPLDEAERQSPAHEEGNRTTNGGMVYELQREADEIAKLPKKKVLMSEWESDWIERLVSKYGCKRSADKRQSEQADPKSDVHGTMDNVLPLEEMDVDRMSKDKRLNVWQLSEGQIKRRVKRWLEELRKKDKHKEL